MARRSLQDDDDATHIDLSPMIDCVFILLIFFIVTTVFVDEKGIQVAKPDAAAVASPEQAENVAFEIDAQGKIHANGQEISLAEVTERVRSAMSDPETPVVIRAHEKSGHGSFVAVWDAAKRGGAAALSFSTIN
jgi:biopolymer transport protein ExbD